MVTYFVARGTLVRPLDTVVERIKVSKEGGGRVGEGVKLICAAGLAGKERKIKKKKKET